MTTLDPDQVDPETPTTHSIDTWYPDDWLNGRIERMLR
jgi:hypothetical protein